MRQSGRMRVREKPGTSGLGEIRRLAPGEPAELLPVLRSDLAGLWAGGVARVDGRRLRNALMGAATGHGASRRSGSAALTTAGPTVTGVTVNGERLGAAAVVVAAVGPGVAGFAEGDRVAWTGVPGSYAEQVVVPAERAVRVPDGVALQVAAAVMLQGMTAHYLSGSTYPVTEGDPVVVHAAAGGVGRLLTQMVKMRGGTVIGTTSTADKAGLARQAGAHHVTGYESFPAVVREVTDGAGAAVVYDGVGRTTFDDSLAVLRPRGYMVLYGAASGPVPPFELRRRAGDLFGWISQGDLDVRVGGTYPLDGAARAHDDLAARRTTGKLLLLPD